MDHPKLLFETGLPPRYYIPPENVREDVLVGSEKTTRCPYKGIASYWSVEVGGDRVEDLIWYYPEPIPEAAKIEAHLAFFKGILGKDILRGDQGVIPYPFLTSLARITVMLLLSSVKHASACPRNI